MDLSNKRLLAKLQAMESMEVKKQKMRIDSPPELAHRWRPCAAGGRRELARSLHNYVDTVHPVCSAAQSQRSPWRCLHDRSQCLSSPNWDMEKEEMGHSKKVREGRRNGVGHR
jgi:hypothetical protein